MWLLSGTDSFSHVYTTHNNTGHVTVVMATMVSVMAVVMAMAEMAMVVAMVIPVTSK